MSTLGNRKKFGPQRSGMTHAKWRAVQALHPGGRRVFNAYMGKPGVNCTPHNKTTMCLNRNAMKRKRRALMIDLAGSVRAFRRERHVGGSLHA